MDATIKGGLAKFINHSCEPNCYSKLITLNGRKAIILYAKRNIEPFEELFYDYFLPYESKSHAIKCLCGSLKCRGWLNWKEGLIEDYNSKKILYSHLPQQFYENLILKKIIPYQFLEFKKENLEIPERI